MSQAKVEVHRIAAQLNVNARKIAYLPENDSAALTRLRNAIAMSTIDSYRHLFERMAQASALLPAVIAARIAQEVLGAELVANLTPFMRPSKAAELAKRMSIEFQADVSIHMVPTFCVELLVALDDDLRAAVTRELLRRKEYAVMGTLVDYLPTEVIGKLAGEIQEPGDLLQITRYVVHKASLRQVVCKFDDATLARMLALAAEEGQMATLVELHPHLTVSDQTRLRHLLPPVSAPEWETALAETLTRVDSVKA